MLRSWSPNNTYRRDDQSNVLKATLTDSVMSFLVAAASATVPRKLASLPPSIRSTFLSRSAGGLVDLPVPISLMIFDGRVACFALLFDDDGGGDFRKLFQGKHRCRRCCWLGDSQRASKSVILCDLSCSPRLTLEVGDFDMPLIVSLFVEMLHFFNVC